MEVTHEYASKGVAGTGLGLGIAGTALGLLNGNGGNGLGGILGGNQNQVNSLMSENAMLKAEKYTDAQVAELYRAKVRDDKELTVFASNIDKRLGALEVAIPLQAQITDGKIAATAAAAECCCKAANAAIASLQAQVGAITKYVVPNTAVCPGWGNVTITPAAATTTTVAGA
jgi:hypothetical protein